MSNRYKLIIYHVLFWITYISLSSFMEFLGDSKNYVFSIGDFLFNQYPNICTVYLSLFVYSKYAGPVKVFPLIVGIIAVYWFSFGNWYLTGYHIRPLIKANGGPAPPFEFVPYLIGTIWIFIKYTFFAFAYYYARRSNKRERTMRLIEKEKHEAEYAFLRAQINPHFLNNTLNFFYAKSLPFSAEVANGIMSLSEIMRYSLEIDKDDRTASLEEEIIHIRNVININQLRFEHELQINFKVNGDTKNVRIIPLILITIVENILKHGNCTDKLNPAKITLSISEEDGRMHLKTYNLKEKGHKELSSGIGMENIKKRLSHHYGSRFTLSIHETETDYSIELLIVQPAILSNQESIKIINDHSAKIQSMNVRPQFGVS